MEKEDFVAIDPEINYIINDCSNLGEALKNAKKIAGTIMEQ